MNLFTFKTLIGPKAGGGLKDVSRTSLAIKFIKSNETYLRAPVDVRRDAHDIGNPQKIPMLLHGLDFSQSSVL